MKTYNVTEIEQSDWDELRIMSKDDAIKILDNDTTLKGYIGSYEPNSTDEYDYYKARIYYAVNKLIKVAKESVSE